MNAVNFTIPQEDRKQTVTMNWAAATDFDNNPNITYTVRKPEEQKNKNLKAFLIFVL